MRSPHGHARILRIGADEARRMPGVRAVLTYENLRPLFLEYMRQVNALAQRPEFYNTLTTNCTSNIWLHASVLPGHLAYSWKVLASGYLPEYLYDAGKLDTRVPFAELERRSIVNERAHAADKAEDFSRLIRMPP